MAGLRDCRVAIGRRMLESAQYAITLGLVLCGSPALAWFDCAWPYRSAVTITENSGTTLTDYQILLQLTAADFDSAYTWSALAEDLRVLDQDDSTQLDHFVEFWDAPSQAGRIWVQLNTLPANSNRTIYLYVGNADGGSASTELTFTEPGIKFNTRQTTANPTNKASAFAALNSAPLETPGYGCTFISDYTGVFNRGEFAPPDRNGDFVAYTESFFEVAPGEAGLWSFRYGGDFGRGGALYVNDVALEEQWNDDLWWAFNWAASAEVLEGSINLTEGYHKLEIIGFEGCCDGGITVQFRKPGGSYTTFQTSSINVVSRKCPVAAPTISTGAMATQLPDLQITLSSAVIDDPINAAANPKTLPGSHTLMSVEVTNAGTGAPAADTVTFTSSIPPNSWLYMPAVPFSFTDGAVPSALGFSYIGPADTGDSVEFSDNGGASFGHVPVPDADGAAASVTDIRVTPSGKMNCGATGANPSFRFDYQLLVP